jgi:hypothetical protein
MPVNNRRSYSNSSNSGSGRGGSSRGNGGNYGRGNGGGRPAASAGRKGGFQKKSKDTFNMLNLLTAFGDVVEWGNDGTPERIKVRALLKTKDGEHVNPLDEQENEYDMREAVELLAAALLEGNGINFYLFLNEDGSYGGNGRINIKGITVEAAEEEEDEEEEEEPAPAPKRKTAAKSAGATKQSQKKTSPSSTKKARDYEADIRNQATEEEEEDEEIVDEDLPL